MHLFYTLDNTEHLHVSSNMDYSDRLSGVRQVVLLVVIIIVVLVGLTTYLF